MGRAIGYFAAEAIGRGFGRSNRLRAETIPAYAVPHTAPYRLIYHTLLEREPMSKTIWYTLARDGEDIVCIPFATRKKAVEALEAVKEGGLLQSQAEFTRMVKRAGCTPAVLGLPIPGVN